MSSGNKQYGLIVSSKNKINITEVKRASIFNEDSDSADEKGGGSSTDWVKKSFQSDAKKGTLGIRKQTQLDMQRALEEDPTVYQYDEVYDELEKKKSDELKQLKDEKRKPRYIQSLLRKAEHRKIENERRIERQVQKEREAEGEQFKDKETFVTSAYKKKLEEFNKLDEEERRQEMLEDICDVKKQQDLGGFYRHLYKTTVDKDNNTTSDTLKNDDKNKDNNDVKKKSDINKVKINKQNEKRQYRKRKTSESSSSLEEGERCSDSDSNDSSSTNSDSSVSTKSSKSSTDGDKYNKHKNKKVKKEVEKVNVKKSKEKNTKKSDNKENIDNKDEILNKEPEEINNVKKDDKSINKSKNEKDNSLKDDENKSSKNIEKEVDHKEDKPKIDIWKKRTVGDVYDEALRRYFERKALQQSIKL